MGGGLPAISGPELIQLLKKDGWYETERRTHGMGLAKDFPDFKLVTVVPTKGRSLPKRTLGQILSVKQTSLGRKGLEKLIKKYS